MWSLRMTLSAMWRRMASDRLQAGPLVLLLQPADIGGDHGGAGLDAPVIGIDSGVNRCGLGRWIVEEGN